MRPLEHRKYDHFHCVQGVSAPLACVPKKHCVPMAEDYSSCNWSTFMPHKKYFHHLARRQDAKSIHEQLLVGQRHARVGESLLQYRVEGVDALHPRDVFDVEPLPLSRPQVAPSMLVHAPDEFLWREAHIAQIVDICLVVV